MKRDHDDKSRTPRGRFRKGTSGNAAGRPAGRRNNASLVLESLLAAEGEAILRKAIEQAKAGEPHILRACLDRLYPARKERLVDLELPDVKTVADAVSAMATILKSVGEGQLTPGEGEMLTAMVEAQGRVMATGEMEQRVERLERAVADKKEADHEIREANSPAGI